MHTGCFFSPFRARVYASVPRVEQRTDLDKRIIDNRQRRYRTEEAIRSHENLCRSSFPFLRRLRHCSGGSKGKGGGVWKAPAVDPLLLRSGGTISNSRCALRIVRQGENIYYMAT